MRMSNRPTKTVTETSRSKTVLNKSAEVLQKTIKRILQKSINMHTHIKGRKAIKNHSKHNTLNTKEPYQGNQASFAFSSAFHIL